MFIESKRNYFASANTSDGFRNYFDQIFNADDLNKIYIIKGGPGTGKSRMMQSIGEFSESHGFRVEYFYCSSDPDSLDGILIPEKAIAVLDGTSPHTTDPKYPGAVEKIVYTGACWNEAKLLENKKQIISLISEKNRYYKKASQFLKAAGEIAQEIFTAGTQNFNFPKMQGAIDRIAEKIFCRSEAFSDTTRLIGAINHKGMQKLETFEIFSKDLYIIEDACFSAQLFLEGLYRKGIATGVKTVKSYSNLFPDRINALFFPELEACFVIGKKNYDTEDKSKNYKYINMRRFVDSEVIAASRQKMKFGKRCLDALVEGAIDNLKEAYWVHSRLEQYYIASMDFSKLGGMIQQIICEIEN